MPPKNLGQVSAISINTVEPTNKKILWYDENADKLKYYNLVGQTWDLLFQEINPETNLSIGNRTTNVLEIVSSSGSNVTLPIATNLLSGILSSLDKEKIDRITITQNVDLDKIVTLTGVPVNSENLGVFLGDLLSDGIGIKQAFQEIESEIEDSNETLIKAERKSFPMFFGENLESIYDIFGIVGNQYEFIEYIFSQKRISDVKVFVRDITNSVDEDDVPFIEMADVIELNLFVNSLGVSSEWDLRGKVTLNSPQYEYGTVELIYKIK